MDNKQCEILNYTRSLNNTITRMKILHCHNKKQSTGNIRVNDVIEIINVSKRHTIYNID